MPLFNKLAAQGLSGIALQASHASITPFTSGAGATDHWWHKPQSLAVYAQLVEHLSNVCHAL